MDNDLSDKLHEILHDFDYYMPTDIMLKTLSHKLWLCLHEYNDFFEYININIREVDCVLNRSSMVILVFFEKHNAFGIIEKEFKSLPNFLETYVNDLVVRRFRIYNILN